MHTRKNGIVIDVSCKRYPKGVVAKQHHYPKMKSVMYVEMRRKYDNSWVHIQSDEKLYIKELRKQGYRKVGVWYADVPA